MASRSRGHVERARLDLGLGGGQRPPGPLRRVEGQHGCLLEERGCRGQAAARLGPAGRAFQLGGDVLVRPGRGLGPVPGAPVGIELPSVASASARCACCLSRPALTGRRPSGPAGGGTAPACRTRPGRPRPRAPPPRRRCRAGRLPARPAPGRRSGRPPRAAAAAGSGPGGRRRGAGSCLRCCPPAVPRRAARTRRPAAPASGRGAARAGPAGCPGSRRRSGPGPACRSARAAPSPAAPAHRRRAARRPPAPAGRPGRRSATRAAKTRPTDSAPRRRATNARTCAEAWSSHCSSSIRQSSGCSLGHLGQQAQHGQADQEPVRRRPGADAERDAQRITLRRGQARPAGRASARTAGAARRRPAPSPTGRHRRAATRQPGACPAR